MDTLGAASSRSIDIGRLIDEAVLAPFHYRLFALCAVTGVLDGLDMQSIGTVASSMAHDLSIPLAHFGPVFSAALLGAAIGGVAIGMLSDRLGRRSLLIVSVLVFGLFTMATALAHSFLGLLVVRLLAGFGLGGAPPCFLALGAEYAPVRIRRSVTSVLWAGFPLGVALGGFLASAILKHFDWRMLFYLGGGLALVLLGFLIPYLPESIRFLARRASTSDRTVIAEIICRLDPKRAVSEQTSLMSAPPNAKNASWEALFRDGLGPTLTLWSACLLTFGTLAIVALWAPPLLRQAGMDAPATALAIAWYGMGGTIGVALAGRLIERFGIVRALGPSLLLGALCIAALGQAGINIPSVGLAMFLAGLGVAIGSSGLVSLASVIYPTTARSMALGWAMGLGRLGQVIGPLFVALLVAAHWMPAQALRIIALGPCAAGICVFLLSRYPMARRCEE